MNWTTSPIILHGLWISTKYDPPEIIPTRILVRDTNIWNPIGNNYLWYHEQPEDLNALVKIKQVINDNLTLDGICAGHNLPHHF